MKVEMNNKSNIGKTFSDRFKDFSLEPAPEVWENVSGRIPSASPNPLLSKGFLFSAGAIAVLLVALVYFYQSRNSASEQTVEKKVNIENITTPLPSKNQLPTENQVVDKSVLEEDNQHTTQLEMVVSCKPDSNESELVKIHKSTSHPVLADTKKAENTLVIPAVKPTNINDNSKTDGKDIQPIAQQTELTPKLQRDNVSFSADPIICFGEDAYLEVVGGETYHWNNGDIMSKTTVHPVANSIYSVTVTDKYGSEHFHDFHVIIDKECTTISVPSAFTPNADGNNDIFKVYGLNISEFKIQIMNRQGQLLFSSNDINQGWDGMYKGEFQPSTVYVYTIIYTNGRGEQKIKNGQFTLLR